MATTFSDPPKAVYTLLDQIAKKYHGHLVETGVTFKILFAANDKGKAPVTLNGWPASAKVKIISLEERAAGNEDCRLVIDEKWWKDASDDERHSRIDRELCRLDIRRDESGIVEDDVGRPKLKLVKPDFQVSGFHSVVEHWGHASAEAVGISEITERWIQGEFDFMQPTAQRSAANSNS